MSGDASPIAWTTGLTIIVASKGTIVINGRICMVLARSFCAITKPPERLKRPRR
jgi:hypothetical protein